MTPSTLVPGGDRRREHLRVRAVRWAGPAVTAAVVLAGCAGGQDEHVNAEAVVSTPPPETITVTSTIEPATEPAPEPDREPAPVECSPSNVPVSADAASIAPPLPGNSWTVWQTGNLCGTLGYAELATAGGTGSSPTQLLLYNEGEFLGTGVRCNALGQVTGSTDESVTVQYRWPIGNDSNANMRGRTTVTFQWTGSSVSMLGELPPEAC